MSDETKALVKQETAIEPEVLPPEKGFTIEFKCYEDPELQEEMSLPVLEIDLLPSNFEFKVKEIE
jgi:hypothetical protein